MAVVSRAPFPLTLCFVLLWSPLVSTLFGRLVAAQEGTPLPTAVDGQHPAVDEQPAVDGQHPAFDGQQPAVDGQHPAVDGQQPAVDGQHPAVDGQHPAVDGQHPAVDGQHPEARYATVKRDFGYIDSLHDTSDEEFSRNAVLQHEFRVPVDAGASQCYYQKFPVNAVLYVSFQVVRGLDRYMELLITGPGNQVLEHIEWSADASMQKKIPVEGVYRLCLKNDKSQFASKLVYFSLLSYKEEEIHEHRKNIQEMFDGTQVIEDSLETVDKRMKQVNLEQALSRRHVISDWYLLRDNNSYVQILSIVLCCVIVATSAFQAFFVRRLFNTGSAMGKKKPRA